MAYLEYNCPICDEEITGGFGDDVECTKCNKTFETDYDTSADGYSCWIVQEKK